MRENATITIMLKRNGPVSKYLLLKQWLFEHASVFAIEIKCFSHVRIENDIISYY